MDQKYLSEIKARAQDAECGEIDAIADSQHDVKSLIAEVERLAAENEQNAAYADIYKDICDKYGKNFRALLDKAKALQTENATLKKALEIASEEVNTAFETLVSHNVLTMEHKASNVQENVDAWIQRARQAQQLTHETHGEAEK